MTIDELKELMETGEEFEVKEKPNHECVFIDSKFYMREKGLEEWIEVEQKLKFFLNSTIIRKPWKPKENEPYSYYFFNVVGEIQINTRLNEMTCYDLLNYAFGNCFRTKEECESHTEIRDKLIEMRKEYV